MKGGSQVAEAFDEEGVSRRRPVVVVHAQEVPLLCHGDLVNIIVGCMVPGNPNQGGRRRRTRLSIIVFHRLTPPKHEAT